VRVAEVSAPSPSSPVAGQRSVWRPKSGPPSFTSADLPPCLALPCWLKSIRSVSVKKPPPPQNPAPPVPHPRHAASSATTVTSADFLPSPARCLWPESSPRLVVQPPAPSSTPPRRSFPPLVHPSSCGRRPCGQREMPNSVRVEVVSILRDSSVLYVLE
jgi:hypothetical protein